MDNQNLDGDPKPENEGGTDPELKKLEEEKNKITKQTELITAKAGLITAEKSLVTAQLPDTSAAPAQITPAVNLDETKPGYVAELVAYGALNKKAKEVAKAINSLSLGNASIMIVDSLELAADDVGLIQLSTQMKYFSSQMKIQVEINQKVIAAAGQVVRSEEERLGAAAITAGLTIASSILSSLSTIGGFFQKEYTIKSRDITIQLSTLQAAVAGQIKNAPIYINKFYRIIDAPLLTKLQECFELRMKLAGNIALLKSLSAQTPAENADAAKKLAQDEVSSSSQALIDAFDKFFTESTTLPQGSTCSPLMLAILRQHYDEMGITHYLYLGLSATGGEVVTKKSNWFWQISKIGILAGGVISTILIEKSGRVVYSDTSTAMIRTKYDLDNEKTIDI
jgi:hypothetical protein